MLKQTLHRRHILRLIKIAKPAEYRACPCSLSIFSHHVVTCAWFFANKAVLQSLSTMSMHNANLLLIFLLESMVVISEAAVTLTS